MDGLKNHHVIGLEEDLVFNKNWYGYRFWSTFSV